MANEEHFSRECHITRTCNRSVDSHSHIMTAPFLKRDRDPEMQGKLTRSCKSTTTTPYPTSRNRAAHRSRRHPSALLCREFIVSGSRVRGKGTTRKELTSPLRGRVYGPAARSIRAAPLFNIHEAYEGDAVGNLLHIPAVERVREAG